MSSLNDLLAQKAELEKQIENLQTTARSDAIAQIKALMADHGLSVADLAGKAVAKKSSQAKGTTVAAKYRNQETGETWSGRGLKPKWLKAQIEAGKMVEDFAV
jgi:DNA-binding protein H-NS